MQSTTHPATNKDFGGLFMADLNEAVKQLRQSLGDSQQQFATRLALSIRALTNYERFRRPSPRALVGMSRLANEHGAVELSRLFWSELEIELGAAGLRAPWQKGKKGKSHIHERSEISQAVRAVRAALGETQTQFAKRMKAATVTVARWETTRPPSSANTLRELSRLAMQHSVPCAAVFIDPQELGGLVISHRLTDRKIRVAGERANMGLAQALPPRFGV
jgi:transcriptional regulator with XRE-family HTH domain